MTDPIPTPRGSSLAYPEMNELFARNKTWSDQMWEKDPGFFPRHFPGQRPEILWIGCSDARVPETTIMGCGPGEIFTIRNIANTYSPHDDSTNGVLAIALQNFKVKHVVITGHSQCVGCQQALNVSRLPTVPATTALQRYIKPIAALASTLTTEDGPCTLDKLVEENVVQQVTNLLVSDIIAQDWKRRGPDGVVVHGWVYHLEDGTIRDLNISQGPPGHIPGKKVNGFF